MEYKVGSDTLKNPHKSRVQFYVSHPAAVTPNEIEMFHDVDPVDAQKYGMKRAQEIALSKGAKKVRIG